MRSVTLLAASLLGVLTAGADGALADVFISVDKATQRMSVLVDGEQRHSWPVSTGLVRYATPIGLYTPFRLVEDHYSKEWDDAPMPHSIFFTSRGHAIHGSDATRRLGSPASHGCIRLSRENAAILFNLVKEQGLENTRVAVSGEEATVVAGKKDQVRTVEGKPVAVARKKDRVQVAEREQRKRRIVAQRASRGQGWAGETRRRVVQYQYPQPQPFWSPFAYGAPFYGYGWR